MTIDKNLVRTVREEGVAIIREYMTELDASNLATEIDNYIDNPVIKNALWVDEFGADHRIFGFERFSAIAKNFHEKINETMSDLYGQEIESTVMAQRVDPVNNNMGSGGTWHRDSIRTQYKAFLYLVKITEQNGPLCVIPNTHKLLNKIREWISFPKIFKVDITRPKQNKSNSRKIICNKGDVLLADTSCIHRGTPNIKKVRYNCTVYAFRKGRFPQHIRNLLN